jgi:flagellar biogenesis protein FliO
MFGAFLVFVFTIFLILIWLIKEFKEWFYGKNVFKT